MQNDISDEEFNSAEFHSKGKNTKKSANSSKISLDKNMSEDMSFEFQYESYNDDIVEFLEPSPVINESSKKEVTYKDGDELVRLPSSDSPNINSTKIKFNNQEYK